MGALRRAAERLVYEPVVTEGDVGSQDFGHLALNIDDIRDLMRRLEHAEWTRAEFDGVLMGRRFDSVQLRSYADNRDYGVDDLEKFPAFAWHAAAVVGRIKTESEHGDDFTDVVPVVFSSEGPSRIQIDDMFTNDAERRLLYDLVGTTVQGSARRRISPRARRQAGVAAILITFGALWFWFVATTKPALPAILLSGALVSLALVLLSERVGARPPHGWPNRVTITSTSRAEMDQRWHDTKKAWKVGVPTTILGATVGAAVTVFIKGF
jgi:hypothetical protein